MDIAFDPHKADSNEKKHGVSFKEASTSLLDSDALVMEDIDSVGENRWVLIGMSEKAKLLTVVYTLRNEDTIRLISARKSSRKEGYCYAR